MASFGAAATTHGSPTTGYDTDQHVDDLRRRGTRVHRGIGLGSVRRLRASDRDQRGKPDERQRLRIELAGLNPAGRGALLAEPSVVDRQQAQHIGVVQSRVP